MKNLLFIFLFLQAIYPLAAQPQTFRFDHVTSKDGLSQSVVNSIYQDSHGYLWFGTQDGLNRFDGCRFTVFKSNPFDSTTLTHNWVWSINEDTNGDLWIGTFQGLCKYVRQENRFVQYYHNMEDSTSISGNRTNFVLRDKKGRLWISAWGRGLNLYDEHKNTFKRFLHNADDSMSIGDDFVRTIFCDSKGTIWVGTWNGGLNRLVEDDKGIRFIRYSILKEGDRDRGKRITSVAEDRQGNMWVATYESGLFRLSEATRSLTHIPGFYDDINKITFDTKGNLWVGSNEGLYFVDHKTQQVSHFTHDPANPEGINSNIIYSIVEDHQGIVWISSSGLDKYDARKNVFKTYRHDPKNPNSLSSNEVWTFCEDDEGKIWIGLESGPINIFDPRQKTFEQITIRDDQGNVASNIRSIRFRNGVFWIGSYNSGLIRYEKKSGKAKFYVATPSSPLSKEPHIEEALPDSDSSVWISTHENGLYHLNPLTDQVQRYTSDPKQPDGLGSNFVSDIFKDKAGNLWLGLWGRGISVKKKGTDKFIHYRYDRKNREGLSDQSVSSIHQENDSIFWICTHTGLNRLNVKTNRFKHFFEKDHLANDVVYEMQKDKTGNYWISTNNGISKLNTNTFRFKNFSEEDGLQSNEFNANASLASSSGEFYFGGVNGFTVFYPEEIKDDTASPRVILQQYKVYEKAFAPQREIELDYHQNYLAFQFTAIEFSAPEKVRYVYKLENFDKEWKNAGNHREAIYTNLDPGHYIFKVKAVSPDGYWSNTEATMAITIQPPFWKTWWFTVTAVIVLAACIYSIHRYRLAQSLKLERLRNKIASDLHDEVGSSLTRISIYSDLLQNSSADIQSKNYLYGISNMSREIVGTMSDIVWSIDNRNDSFGALLIRMKDFASEVLQAKNIEMDFAVKGIDQHKILDPALKQNLYLIFKESVNNIVKHAQASSVHITITNTQGNFVMIIQDNGRGFSRNGTDRGNGLRNMERRAKAIGASFILECHSGTRLSVKRKEI